MNTKLYIGIFFFSIEEDVEKTLKTLLKETVGIREIRTDKKESGKPYFITPEDWYYNISHSGKLGVCAFGQSELGIDIEKIKSNRDFLSIAETWFSEKESYHLLKSESDSIVLFYHLWTRKESTIKQLGKSVWNMKDMPDMSLEREDVKTWIFKKGEDTYSLSLSIDLQKNKDLQINFLEKKRVSI
jgi:phosphopantetheine--protein transferase-like protein